ncbi:UNVERIFIED_CONTAM: Transcription factor [Sesamum angustifolium]|uniref:Transcription factor n=1 Tax=Sesamum angustifolium TaxID=2727405 RepID=A0AAW2J7Z4_9LAMI
MGRAPCCDKANVKKGPWSPEEDAKLKAYIEKYRWSINAAQLPGRTDNDIKNYWNTRLKKKLLGRRKQANSNRLSIPGQEPKDASDEENSCDLQNLSSSALERASAPCTFRASKIPSPFTMILHFGPRR